MFQILETNISIRVVFFMVSFCGNFTSISSKSHLGLPSLSTKSLTALLNAASLCQIFHCNGFMLLHIAVLTSLPKAL